MVFDVWPVYSGERFRAPGPSRFFFFFFFFFGGGGGGWRGGVEVYFLGQNAPCGKIVFSNIT